MSYMAQALHSLANTVANLRGREPAYIVDETSIKLKYVKPSDTENFAWEKLYEWGNIFISGKANPLKINVRKETVEDSNDKERNIKEDFIASQKYKTFMKNNVLKQAMATDRAKSDTLYKLLIGVLGVQVVSTAVIIAAMNA